MPTPKQQRRRAQDSSFDAERGGARPKFTDLKRRVWTGGICHDRQMIQTRDNLLKQFEAFGREIGRLNRQSYWLPPPQPARRRGRQDASPDPPTHASPCLWLQ